MLVDNLHHQEGPQPIFERSFRMRAFRPSSQANREDDEDDFSRDPRVGLYTKRAERKQPLFSEQQPQRQEEETE